MTTEEKFRAAVNVIRGLPKKGSFSASNDLKLKFYGYFKQATDGPNTTPKPYIWDVVNKLKWDAWKRLDDMSKEDAMLEYLRELNKIVESIASSGTVEDFLVGMEDFYAKVPAEDVDLCIGPTIAKIKAQSATPLPSHPAAKPSHPPIYATENKLEEEEDEFFLDSIDTIVVGDENVTSSLGLDQKVYTNGHSGTGKDVQCESTIDILSRSVAKIHTDLNQITESVQKIQRQQVSILKGRNRLFGNLSPQTIAFVTLWPVLVNLGLIWLYSKKKNYQ